MKKHIRKVGDILLLTLCIFFILFTPVRAENTDGWKTVRVSANINNSLKVDEDGNATGYCAEYLQQLAIINHWNLEYVPASWTDSVQNLMDGKIDLLFPTQQTKERLSTMGFSDSIGGYQPIGLYAASESDLCFDDYEGFDGAKVALSAGTSNETAMQEYANLHDFSYTPVYLNTTADKMNALERGDVDLIVFSTLNDVPNGKVVAMLDYLPFYYCTNIQNTELLNELNTGMRQMLVRHPDTVQDVFYSFMNKNVHFAYTKEEQEVIATKGTIKVGIYTDTAPLFDVQQDGTQEGVYVDILKRIELLSGLDIEIVPIDRSNYSFDVLKANEVDFTLGTSDKALDYVDQNTYDKSEGVLDYYTVGITQKGFTQSGDEPISFALTGARRYWVTEILEKYPSATFTYYDSPKACLDAVANGKADITYLNTWEYNYHSKNQRYEDLIEWENTRAYSQTVFVSLADQNSAILTVINKAIEQISNSEKEGMITANLNLPYHSANTQDRLYEIKDVLIYGSFILFVIIITLTVYFKQRHTSMKKLQAKNEQLEEANQSKDVFLSRMSHELRTPLNAIHGYTDVMQEGIQKHNVNEVQQQSYLDSISRAVSYQLAIIDDLLDIQKIETGKMELHPTEVNLASVLNNIASMIQPEVEKKKITFHYEPKKKSSELYVLDSVRFEQVLLNLLHNAVKFTPEEGEITFTSEIIDQTDSTSTLKFVISDTGIGMSEDFQNNYLFHKFAQEYQGNTSPYEGCGTGLALSREIMHLMGGEITCESEQDVGSTFTVVCTTKHIKPEKRKRQPINYDEYSLENIHILLCEDNQMNQDMECRILERMKATVDVADDGAIGVQRFQESPVGTYDIVLMDIRMPNMDGYDATIAIRNSDRPDAKTVPIVAVSANSFPEDIQKCLDCGMNEHLAKPVDVKRFYQSIIALVHPEQD